MKRVSVLAFLLLAIISLSYSQDEMTTNTAATGSSSFTSKNGHEVLPQQGDFALTIGASTILRYAGNLFGKSNNNNNTGFMEYPNQNIPSIVIGGKYMMSGNTALRLAARIYYNNSTSKIRVVDDLSINPDDFLYDKSKTSNAGVILGAGIEKRRGTARLHGVYGVEAYVSYTNGNVMTYEYANDFSITNQFPTSSNFTNNTNLPEPTLGYRINRQSLSDGFGIGVNLFAGVEYFVAPKMSLGGEFYWGINYSMNTGETLTYESFDPIHDSVIEYSVKGEGTREFGADISNLGGSINLNFYF